MLRTLLFVGIGGMAGSMGRYLTYWLIHNRAQVVFPWGTWVVNVLGSFLIGILYAKSLEGNMGDEWKALLITGFCGGFTTFSAFSYESLSLLRQGQYLQGLLYIGGSVLVCLACTGLGMHLSKG